MKTSVLLDHDPVADGGFLVRALLNIEGDPPRDERRVPLNLSLVLDRSGSMSGEPLRAARKAAAMLVRRLAPDDTVSVVAYDDDVRVVAPPAAGPEQKALAAEIEGIHPGGMTNLSGGWLRGRELVAQHLREGAVNRILLLTDGRANVGITDPDALVGLCGTAAEHGVQTTTIGFGTEYDEDLLRAMADAGHGGAYYIEKPDQASGVFEEELEGLLSMAAQNVRVSVTPGTDAEFIQVVHQYPSHAEGKELTIDVGDLYAREPRRVLLEFLLGPATEVGTDARVGQLLVTAQVLTPQGGVEQRTIDLPITLSPEDGGKVEPAVRKEVLLQEAASARDEALDAGRRGDYRRGRDLLRDTATMLTREAPDDPDLAEEARDLTVMEERFRTEEVGEKDVKYMKQRVYESQRSRYGATDRIRRTSEE